jgi:hypothetical protein
MRAHARATREGRPHCCQQARAGSVAHTIQFSDIHRVHAGQCPPEQRTEPDINYLAKDYNSFRQLMLDRMSGARVLQTRRFHRMRSRHTVPPGVPGITFQTPLQNGVTISDVPGPTGGILIRAASGASIAINDVGITISANAITLQNR